MSEVTYSTAREPPTSLLCSVLPRERVLPSARSVNWLQVGYLTIELLPITTNITEPGSSEVQTRRGSNLSGSGVSLVFWITTPVCGSTSRTLWPFWQEGGSWARADRLARNVERAIMMTTLRDGTRLILESSSRPWRERRAPARRVTRPWAGGFREAGPDLALCSSATGTPRF